MEDGNRGQRFKNPQGIRYKYCSHMNKIVRENCLRAGSCPFAPGSGHKGEMPCKGIQSGYSGGTEGQEDNVPLT